MRPPSPLIFTRPALSPETVRTPAVSPRAANTDRPGGGHGRPRKTAEPVPEQPVTTEAVRCRIRSRPPPRCSRLVRPCRTRPGRTVSRLKMYRLSHHFCRLSTAVGAIFGPGTSRRRAGRPAQPALRSRTTGLLCGIMVAGRSGSEWGKCGRKSRPAASPDVSPIHLRTAAGLLELYPGRTCGSTRRGRES